MVVFTFFFFFSSRRRHTRLQGDWSSDVCSSDLFSKVRSGARLPLPATLGAGRARRECVLWPGRPCGRPQPVRRSEEHTSELQSPCNLVCRLLLEKKKKKKTKITELLYTWSTSCY